MYVPGLIGGFGLYSRTLAFGSRVCGSSDRRGRQIPMFQLPGNHIWSPLEAMGEPGLQDCSKREPCNVKVCRIDVLHIVASLIAQAPARRGHGCAPYYKNQKSQNYKPIFPKLYSDSPELASTHYFGSDLDPPTTLSYTPSTHY